MANTVEQNRVLWMGDIQPNMTEDNLAQALTMSGFNPSIRILKPKNDDHTSHSVPNRRCAFLTFESEQQAVQAMRTLNEKPYPNFANQLFNLKLSNKDPHSRNPNPGTYRHPHHHTMVGITPQQTAPSLPNMPPHHALTVNQQISLPPFAGRSLMIGPGGGAPLAGPNTNNTPLQRQQHSTASTSGYVPGPTGRAQKRDMPYGQTFTPASSMVISPSLTKSVSTGSSGVGSGSSLETSPNHIDPNNNPSCAVTSSVTTSPGSNKNKGKGNPGSSGGRGQPPLRGNYKGPPKVTDNTPSSSSPSAASSSTKKSTSRPSSPSESVSRPTSARDTPSRTGGDRDRDRSTAGVSGVSNGRPLSRTSQSSSSQHNHENMAFVGMLNPDLTSDQLEGAIREIFPQVVSINLIGDMVDPAKNRGFAFVKLNNEEEYQRFVESQGDLRDKLNNPSLKISKAHPRPAFQNNHHHNNNRMAYHGGGGPGHMHRTQGPPGGGYRPQGFNSYNPRPNMQSINYLNHHNMSQVGHQQSQQQQQHVINSGGHQGPSNVGQSSMVMHSMVHSMPPPPRTPNHRVSNPNSTDVSPSNHDMRTPGLPNDMSSAVSPHMAPGPMMNVPNHYGHGMHHHPHQLMVAAGPNGSGGSGGAYLPGPMMYMLNDSNFSIPHYVDPTNNMVYPLPPMVGPSYPPQHPPLGPSSPHELYASSGDGSGYGTPGFFYQPNSYGYGPSQGPYGSMAPPPTGQYEHYAQYSYPLYTPGMGGDPVMDSLDTRMSGLSMGMPHQQPQHHGAPMPYGAMMGSGNNNGTITMSPSVPSHENTIHTAVTVSSTSSSAIASGPNDNGNDGLSSDVHTPDPSIYTSQDVRSGAGAGLTEQPANNI